VLIGCYCKLKKTYGTSTDIPDSIGGVDLLVTENNSPVMSRASTQIVVRWFVALLLVVAAGCGTGEQRAADETPSTIPQKAIQFAHVTVEAGLGDFQHVTGAFGEKWFPETVGAGAGFLDYDGDGWQDLVLVGGGTWPGHGDPPPRALRLYRNQGDGTFSDVTEEVGLADLRAYGLGVAIADYDNDGDPDIFLSTLRRNLLLRNDLGSPDSRIPGSSPGQARTFTEVGRAAGLGDTAEWSTSALFFDADLDGHVDLYVGNYVDWSPENDIWCSIDGQTKAYCTPQLYLGIPGRFYHNNGEGTFSDWTERAGFSSSPGRTLGVAEWDFNRDGWPDLVVANDLYRDLLYLNKGDGTFTEQGVVSGLAFDKNGKARAGMGIDIGVIDSTGQPSVIIGHFSNEMIGLYRQVGPALFVDRAAESQVGQPSLRTLTFGLCLFDPDLDGDLDLFVANGHIAEGIERVREEVTFRQYPQLFVNGGNGRFIEHAPPLAAPMVARAVAMADYDRDGDVDLLVTENGGPVHLLRNDQQGGHVLRVRLEGRRGNRDALGAHVTAVVGKTRMQQRLRTGSSFLASSEKALTFGLGAATRVDTLTVWWPGGQVAHYTDLPAAHEVRIIEGDGQIETRPLPTPIRVARP